MDESSPLRSLPSSGTSQECFTSQGTSSILLILQNDILVHPSQAIRAFEICSRAESRACQPSDNNSSTSSATG